MLCVMERVEWSGVGVVGVLRPQWAEPDEGLAPVGYKRQGKADRGSSESGDSKKET